MQRHLLGLALAGIGILSLPQLTFAQGYGCYPGSAYPSCDCPGSCYPVYSTPYGPEPCPYTPCYGNAFGCTGGIYPSVTITVHPNVPYYPNQPLNPGFKQSQIPKATIPPAASGQLPQGNASQAGAPAQGAEPLQANPPQPQATPGTLPAPPGDVPQSTEVSPKNP